MQLKAFLVAILAVSVFVTNSSGQFFTKTSKSIPRMGRRADNNLMVNFQFSKVNPFTYKLNFVYIFRIQLVRNLVSNHWTTLTLKLFDFYYGIWPSTLPNDNQS